MNIKGGVIKAIDQNNNDNVDSGCIWFTIAIAKVLDCNPITAMNDKHEKIKNKVNFTIVNVIFSSL